MRRVADLWVKRAQHEQHAAAEQLAAAVLRLQQQLRLRAGRGGASASAWRGGRNRAKAAVAAGRRRHATLMARATHAAAPAS